MVFLYVPGSSGKTFLINLILAKMRSKASIALTVASSSIAATLLEGGRTAHSAFKLPQSVNHADKAVCSIKRGTDTVKVLQECNVIIWDECTMSHKHAFEGLNKTLQNIRLNYYIFGSVTMVLSVVPRGTRADEVNASVKISFLWNNVHKIYLKRNMRVHLTGNSEPGELAKLLLKIGAGKIPIEPHSSNIVIPSMCGKLFSNVDELAEVVFPSLGENYRNSSWLSKRAILVPRNDVVNEIICKLL
ncbi:uncharacterized protein LOC106470836 [Limulus polyphemus]|uniref:ATP-dependent DNA helicase n=1 Tax=Limulus polyphemus TaxID=6850 RepID=A0ABM1BQS8_LIMPO|nr:uncharacterized protein LOC106470836 [Limulus polyphemus]